MRIMHIILSRGFAGSERYAAELASFQAAEHDVMLIVRRTHRSRFGTSVVDAVYWPGGRVITGLFPLLPGGVTGVLGKDRFPIADAE